MGFGRNFCEKPQMWVSEPLLGEVRGDPQLMARWKAHVRLYICVSWTFSLSITVPELWGEMCTAWLFSVFAEGLTSLHSNFT